MPQTRVVLFDMGGVLVDLAPLDELLGVTMAPEEFWPRWLACEAVRSYERGGCSDHEFAAGLIADFDLALSPDDVLDRFERFPRGLLPGAADLVGAVADGVATGVLSNTNQLHWDHQRDNEILRSLFDHEFLSYRLGLVKPDLAIYQAVVAQLGVAPGEILFVDDNQINVDGARAAGLDAHVARGPVEARTVLARRGVLAGG